MPPFFVGLSLAANMTSVATFVINPGLVHAYGWSGVVGYGIAAPGVVEPAFGVRNLPGKVPGIEGFPIRERLEERLGVQLLRRTTRRLSLTETGKSYYEHSARILADLDEAEAAVAQEHGELRGQLRVALPLSFGMRHIYEPIAEFSRQHPRVRFDLDLNDRRIDLIAEGVDLAVRSFADRPNLTVGAFGGLVVDDSIKRAEGSLDVHFRVTDTADEPGIDEALRHHRRDAQEYGHGHVGEVPTDRTVG